MLVLADVADNGTAEIPDRFNPSLAILADQTGLDRRTVQRHLTALETAGWISRLRPGIADQLKGERVRYRLQVAAGDRQTGGGMVPPGGSMPPDNDSPVAAENPSAGGPVPPYKAPSTTPQPQEPSSSAKTPTGDRPDVEKICRHLADRIVDNGSKRPTITAKWRTEARLLIDKDHRSVEQVIKAIDWCQTDPFWRANILSMPTLRDKYDQLRLAAARNGHARASPGLVEVDGLRLRPETAARLADRQRFEAMDRAHEQREIEGPT